MAAVGCRSSVTNRPKTALRPLFFHLNRESTGGTAGYGELGSDTFARLRNRRYNSRIVVNAMTPFGHIKYEALFSKESRVLLLNGGDSVNGTVRHIYITYIFLPATMLYDYHIGATSRIVHIHRTQQVSS